MLEVCDVLQLRVEVSHHCHDGLCCAVALFTVFDRDGMLNHLLDVAAIFGDDEPVAG